MSKQAKRRAKIVMTDSLAEKLDNMDNANEKGVYEPSKINSEFLDIVDESITEEEEEMKRQRQKSSKSIVIALSILAITLLSAGVFIFVSNS